MDTSLVFQLHYFLEKENLHVMNANVHNESERYLLSAIKNLQKYIGDEIIVKTFPKKEGGVIDLYSIVIENIAPHLDALFMALLVAWVNRQFRPAIHKTEEQKNRLDILEKLRKGEYTEEELDYIIQGDPELSKLRSKYYQSISKDSSVSKIEAQTYSDENKNQGKEVEIKRADFSGHIINKVEYNTSVDVKATIYIVAPILVKGRKFRWRGLYINQPIEFRVEDSEFLKQVYAHEIKFGTGTSISCTLRIETKTIINNASGFEDEIVTESYYVKDVYQWQDDDTFQYETKRYKKIKAEKLQLALFNDNPQ
ncbi:MAG: hypothetical protein LBM06_00540 [Prevotellaceae bacterium]|jgi:hypothetical protein|nr:hypothetical protein [Prevotellaceae bacterium]